MKGRLRIRKMRWMDIENSLWNSVNERDTYDK